MHAGIEKFTQSEINSKKCQIKDSSILRVMTKWV